MRFSALVLLALFAGALGATKYAENYRGQLQPASTTITTGTAANGPIGTIPASALEWFYYGAVTDPCYTLWSTSTSACGSLPGSEDDVILGKGIQASGTQGGATLPTGFSTGVQYLGVGAAPTTPDPLFFSFNSPRLNCPTTTPAAADAGACLGINTHVVPSPDPRNAVIKSLTIWAGVTTAQSTTTFLGPISFTGYPRATGTYGSAVTTWSVDASSRLTVNSTIMFRQTNTALYGSGFGVSLGGLNAGGAAAYGNAAFSAESTYADTAVAGARNGLHGTDDNALAWFSAHLAESAAMANKSNYGFIVEARTILVDGCGYVDNVAGTRCTGGYAATEIQGPNLYVQPVTAGATVADAAITTSAAAGSQRVNITITAGSILFTTSTVYINADFTILQGGALALCEPANRADGAASTQGFSNVLGNVPALTTAAPPLPVNNGVSFLSGNGAVSQAWCSPVATNAFDWFGVEFASVTITNLNAPGVLSVLYSGLSPNVAKLAVTYGPFYTVPVVGNVVIQPTNDAQTVVAPLVIDTHAIPATTAVGGAAAVPRFVGFQIPYTGATSATTTNNPYVNTYDCANPTDSGAPVAASASFRGDTGAVCAGHAIPSRFSFLRGNSSIVSGVERQLVELSQYDLISVGEGSLTFQGSFQLCGSFGARSNGFVNFPAEPNAPLAFGGRTPGTRRFGQFLSTFPAARGTPPASAITASSTANPTPDFATTTTGLTYNTTLVPLIPMSAAVGAPLPTCTPAAFAAAPATADGTGCTMGTYSYLVTGPTSGAVRPAVVQVTCVAGTCRPVLVDRGCYTTFPDGTGTPPAPTGVLVLSNVTQPGVRGYCSTPAVAELTQDANVGTTDVAPYCSATSFSGLASFPSSARSSGTVGLVQIAKPVTIEASDVKFSATTVRSSAGLTVVDVTEESLSVGAAAQVPSTLVVADGADLVIEGGVVATNTLSSLTVAGSSFLTISTGSLGAGSFIVNGTLRFVGSSASIASSSLGGVVSAVNPTAARTVLTGTGSILYSGVTTTTSLLTGNTGVFSQVATTINGTLDIQGQYVQQTAAITVTGVIGSSVAGGLTLSNGASLVFNGGSIGTRNLANTQQFVITIADSASSLVISAGNSSAVTTPALVTYTGNATVVFVQGSLQSVNVPLTLTANTEVTGTLGGAASSIVIGSNTGTAYAVTTAGGAATLAGSFRLYPNSQIVNSGNTTVAAGTTVEAVAATTPTNTTAVFNYGTMVLAGAFAPSVNVTNNGSIVINTQAFTVSAGRALRLIQGGSVSGAGSVVIDGSVVVESGASRLTPTTLINNGAITVFEQAILTVSACLTGTGSIGGPGQVIYEGQSGCSVNGNFNNLVLFGNTTANGGLTIITGQLGGNGTFTAGANGYISINNANALSLLVSGNPAIGAVSAVNLVTLSGTVTVGSGASLTVGQAVVGIRNPVTFAVNSNGVVFALLSGQLSLLSSLVVPVGAVFQTAGTVTGGSLQVGGVLQVTGAAAFTGTSVLIAAGGRVNATAGGSLTLNAGTSFVVSPNATFGGFALTVNSGANFSFGGNFTGTTTITGAVLITSNVVVPLGASVTINGLATCASGVTVRANGAINFAGGYTGCGIAGNVRGNPATGSQGAFTQIEVSTLWTLQQVETIISANTHVVITGPTIITCPIGSASSPCTITVNGNLTLPFYLACNNGNAINFRNITGSCGPEGATGALYAAPGVVLVINGVFELISGNANNLTAASNWTASIQDAPTYPIGTVDALVLSSTAHTVVVTTGNNVNPLIVRSRLQLGGWLEVRTLTFVPLRPVVIMRLANTNSTGITGSFSKVNVAYDSSRSSHNFAWNLGFPTVRVVGRDVILDPNGNGSSAAGVVPSFLLAVFAIVAALYVRN